jgi:uncharacterized membrane protein
MMSIKGFIQNFKQKITGSIAFYPAVISAGFFLLALSMLFINYKNFFPGMRDFLSPVLVKTPEDARLILGTLVGSIISLMVFSFSMVMIVLNRASSTLTPRVIPGLISRKSHQVVLGVYLGTIIYSLILIINVYPSSYAMKLPGIGILLAMIFGITSLGLFIYFIDDISRAIQSDNILQEIFTNTQSKMSSYEVEKTAAKALPDRKEWEVIKTREAGYLKRIRLDKLVELAKENDLVISVEENIGFFMVMNYPFLRVNKIVSEEVKGELLNCFVFYTQEHVNDHYLFGFKQISEIGIKALSPGINDPGTAIKAIDLLSILFIERMRMVERRYVMDEDDVERVWLPGLSLKSLLYAIMTPLREYGKNDASIMLKLLSFMKNLGYADIDQREHQEVLREFVESLVSSCRSYVDNSLDKEQINKALAEVSSVLSVSVTKL